MRSIGTWLVLALTASACGAQQAETTAPAQGHYIWGAEVNVFSPCGSDLEFWVEAEPTVIQSLRDQYTAFRLPPYTAVFVEVVGETGPVLDCGFCESYDGSFKITELIRMESPGPEDCMTEMGRAPQENGA